jgi:hypothetical protein
VSFPIQNGDFYIVTLVYQRVTGNNMVKLLAPLRGPIQSGEVIGGFSQGLFGTWGVAMGNGLFIDGLPIKNGDFPWLC